ncbi:hypothetical protein TeGR_g8869 [Tetraparma gracilis]|uniref:Linalool dehydratase/isomerase domain-containing protein n=1 Tax=Tetraparma gracilis TaxID=2962635 RepID=A0ABQ6M6N5_9STRA|nr:hypothetical protein TeGR_g8869 [Tetraparma gracilis]
MHLRIAILALLVTLASSSLHFTPGTLEGTDLDAEGGLTDKQLSVFNWLEGNVHSKLVTGEWPPIYQTNQTGNLPIQRGMPSYRYSLAFSAYAAAARALTHHPAYTSSTFQLLSNIFTLLTDPDVWSFWSQSGDCAPFFLTPYCEKHQVSMCDLDAAWHGEDATRCPDPVFFGNIMYSGHLAHVGSLVRLFAPTPSAADEVLSFSLGETSYTLDSLLDRLRAQSNDSIDTLGGGITCEPANVYPSCQSHSQAALRLSAVLDDGNTTESQTRLRQAWQQYLLSENMFEHLDSGPLGERMFKIAQQSPRHPAIPDFGIPIGCASHDVWVLAYMLAWADDDLGDDVPRPGEVVARGRELLREHPGWKDGQLQDERCSLLAGEENWDTASAMFVLLESAVSRGGDGDMARAKEAILRFEKQAEASANEMHYTSSYGLDVLVTTQLAMGFVVEANTMADLHGAAGVEALRRDGGGWLDEVLSKGGEQVFVRTAKRAVGGGALAFTLVTGSASKDVAVARIGGVQRQGVRVLVNGEKVEGRVDGRLFEVEVQLQDGLDAVVEVSW